MNSYLFVKDVQIYKFKAKDSEINTALLCLGNVSNNFSGDNIRLYQYVYAFSVDFDSIDVAVILDIQKYLMKKYDIKQCLHLLRNVYWIIKRLCNRNFL